MKVTKKPLRYITTYVYDPAGNLTSIANPQAGLNTYANDSLNRESKRTTAPC
jgi:YD repeat-containing protein